MMSAAAPEALSISDTLLYDGPRWTLAHGGLGRPCLVRIILANDGSTPLTLWAPDSPEGQRCVSLTLTPATGGEARILRPLPAPRAGGVPTAVTLAPGRNLILEFELLRLIGTNAPPPGTYRLQAAYENALAESGPVRRVWTGRLQGPMRDLEIIPPAPR